MKPAQRKRPARDAPAPRRKPPRAGMGRPKGALNRVNADARAVFKLLLEANAPELQGWLDRIAKRQPARAFELVCKLAEFVLRKLARTELSGPGGGPIPVTPAGVALRLKAGDPKEAMRVYQEVIARGAPALAYEQQRAPLPQHSAER